MQATNQAAHGRQSLVEQVVTGCRVLGAGDQGDPVWGHVTCRDPEGRGVWMKGGAKGFDEVTAADVVLIDLDGHRLEGVETVPYEYPLHTEILRVRPDVGSVVHTHPPYALAVAASGVPLSVFASAAGPFAGGVPRFDGEFALIDTPEVGREVAECLGAAKALLHIGHGIITVGTSVATAVTTAILLERACRLQVLATALGGPAPAFLDPGDRYKHTLNDRYLLRTWDYLVRSLETKK